MSDFPSMGQAMADTSNASHVMAVSGAATAGTGGLSTWLATGNEWGLIFAGIGALCAVVSCATNVYKTYRDIQHKDS